VNAQISRQSESSNNTSACVAGSATSASPCTATFPGQTDPRAGVKTPTFNSSPSNVAKEAQTPLTTFLYPQRTTKVYVNFIPAFIACSSPVPTLTPTGLTVPKCGNITVTDYTSDDYTSVQKQAADIMSRGFDGLVVD
jgi:hypothetical protein